MHFNCILLIQLLASAANLTPIFFINNLGMVFVMYKVKQYILKCFTFRNYEKQ